MAATKKSRKLCKELELLINYLFNQIGESNLCSTGKERLRWIIANGHRFKSLQEMVSTWTDREQKAFFAYFNVAPQIPVADLKARIKAHQDYIKGYQVQIKNYTAHIREAEGVIKTSTAALVKAKDQPAFGEEQYGYVLRQIFRSNGE